MLEQTVLFYFNGGPLDGVPYQGSGPPCPVGGVTHWILNKPGVNPLKATTYSYQYRDAPKPGLYFLCQHKPIGEKPGVNCVLFNRQEELTKQSEADAFAVSPMPQHQCKSFDDVVKSISSGFTPNKMVQPQEASQLPPIDSPLIELPPWYAYPDNIPFIVLPQPFATMVASGKRMFLSKPEHFKYKAPCLVAIKSMPREVDYGFLRQTYESIWKDSYGDGATFDSLPIGSVVGFAVLWKSIEKKSLDFSGIPDNIMVREKQFSEFTYDKVWVIGGALPVAAISEGVDSASFRGAREHLERCPLIPESWLLCANLIS